MHLFVKIISLLEGAWPKGPCTTTVDISALKYLWRDYFTCDPKPYKIVGYDQVFGSQGKAYLSTNYVGTWTSGWFLSVNPEP